jgi:hypothetical protein
MILPGLTILFKIVSVTLSSWLLIHILAAFGVFLAVAYPIWWFITPTKIICLECRVRKGLNWCNFCQHKIENGQVYPKNLRSTFLNSFLILIFTIVSFSIVYAEAKLLARVNAQINNRTASFTIPGNMTYKIGETFPFSIDIEGIRTAINTVQVDISFDPEVLEAVNISTHNSFAKVFIEREIYNDIGFVRLTGGLPNPGYKQEKGSFGTIYFRGKSPGITEIQFLPTSVILANDGRGTNVLGSLTTTPVLILTEPISDEERAKEAEIIIDPIVLGEAAEGTQLHLYSESRDNRILGLKADGDAVLLEDQSPTFFQGVLNFIHKIDDFIIDAWRSVVSAVYSTIFR